MKNYCLVIASMIELAKPWKVLLIFKNCEPYCHGRACLLPINPLGRDLDYRDVIYGHSLNSNRTESVQYKATLAIAGAIKDHLKKNYTRNYV